MVQWVRIRLVKQGRKSESVSCSVVVDFLQPHGLGPGVKKSWTGLSTHARKVCNLVSFVTGIHL